MKDVEKDEVVEKRTTVLLACKLTDSEFRQRAVELAKVEGDVSALEARHESIKQTIKSEAAELAAKRAKLSGIVDRGEEFRDVSVEILHDYKRGRVYHTRMDTGEIYVDRGMTEGERQRALPLPA